MGQPTHDTTTAESQTPNTSTPTEAAPESSAEAAPQPDPTGSTEAATTSASSPVPETTKISPELTGAAAMFANDRASQHLGITVDDHGPGWAQCSMTVTTSASSPVPETTKISPELTGAAAMFANDRASQHLGITVDDHGPGWAQCSMTVTEIMTNGHDITHGGYVFLFADTTFAMACNYPGSITVASGGDIDFLKPTHLGDQLVARGHEVVKQGRSGIYDVTVTRGDDIIATYRGRSRTLPTRK